MTALFNRVLTALFRSLRRRLWRIRFNADFEFGNFTPVFLVLERRQIRVRIPGSLRGVKRPNFSFDRQFGGG